ncbi:hypothetical protein [Prosthecochloris sp. HL-130-GSB]|jgi:hypothetical protein|uniref:hypothetical protein n=1 Tax=Prosthecochloris sp. HL-130-GSB TaxID=1974213 RepID=UPI000A1C12B2|nr:hypothetical protein [Prosthecochloris sp. HL-130-GSB]ARM31536.1 hypothetical protein B9H02_09815 [Prosthecochloris sp. HL-130-GSB]
MANISTYVSGHTDINDVSEFFQKQLLQAGERPIAFFDGVFYESHQERVGNILYQDYLIYSDRAVYLWARGTTKDYLDRFPLGAVTINSRNKDNDFATLNLRIRREQKEPVYVIFDMVEIDEAERISTLHTIIESTIETFLGSNYRQELPDDVAAKIFESARSTCPPRSLSLQYSATPPPTDSRIGYGQDLLEQYKASIGYGSAAGASQPGYQQAQGPAGGRSPQETLKNLEGVLPSDPEALKRVASNLKDMIGEAPFKFRDQVMKDLQHVPNDVATVLKAVNELITNISDNPQAEKFVMNAIQTAVRNDGIIGSFSKLLKMGSAFGPMGKKPQAQDSRPGSAASSGSTSQGMQEDATSAEPGGVRRKKIRITSEDASSGGQGNTGESAPAQRSRDLDDEPGVQRKKIRVKVDDSVRNPLTAGPDPEPEPEHLPAEPVRQKKLRVKVEESEPAVRLDEDELASALKETDDSGVSGSPAASGSGQDDPGERQVRRVYKTVESDVSGASERVGKTEPGSGDETGGETPEKKQVIKVKSSQ